ncbi:MAG: hypothetical protein ACM3X4_12260 [Ignavibacteriales bacterium]
MKKERLLALLVSMSLVMSLLAGCTQSSAPPPAKPAETSTPPKPAKDNLVFGGVRSQSGPFALFDQIAFGPIYPCGSMR